MLASGTHYQDRSVDYEALSVARNAPRWIKMLRKHGFMADYRSRLIDQPSAAPMHRPASGQALCASAGGVFHIKMRPPIAARRRSLTMTRDLVLTTTQGAVRTLTLNRPAALNSFTGAMHAQLLAALNAAATDAAVRALIVTGAGRGFCAGQDLNDPEMARPTARRRMSARSSSATTRRWRCASARCRCR